jgi:hypothetical protein
LPTIYNRIHTTHIIQIYIKILPTITHAGRPQPNHLTPVWCGFLIPSDTNALHRLWGIFFLSGMNWGRISAVSDLYIALLETQDVFPYSVRLFHRGNNVTLSDFLFLAIQQDMVEVYWCVAYSHATTPCCSSV